MKKTVSIIMCLVMLATMVLLGVSVSAVDLPDGGQAVGNTGSSYVTGRTSGGDDGYANMICTISISHGTTDVAIVRTKSDVVSGINVHAQGWITFADLTETKTNTVYNYSTGTLPSSGFVVRVSADNAYSTYATGAHSAYTTTRGNWICGTTVYA